MSKCVEKLSHSCNSKSGLQVFEKEGGGYDGYCFACGTYVPNPYDDKPEGYKPVYVKKSEEEIKKEVDEITEYETCDLPERKLRKESLEYFGIKIGVSETDGVTPTSHYYPYYKEGVLTGYKARVIEGKKFFAKGSIKGCDLFGWEQAIAAGNKKLFVVEGEIDAVSLYQIFKDHNKNTQYAHLHPSVVSLPHGAGCAVKELSRFSAEIRKHFKEIVLVFDNDAAGRKAAEDVMKVLPEAMVASLPDKDVNDCLVKGKSRACYTAIVFNAKKPKNTRIVSGASLHEAAKEPPKYGVSWPWRHITEATRGIRLGETIYIGAAQKMGKSEVVNTLAAHFIKEHGWKTFLIKPEESNIKTYKMVASKMVGKFFHDPTKPFDDEAFERAGEMIGDNLFMLDLYQHVGWETLKADIRAAALEGCKVIILDPITNLTNGMNPSDANTRLQEIAQELAAMALDLNVVIFIFCHLRNPDSGVPHERGGEVLSSQFAGSRAMARSCNYMLGIEGNRDPNLTPEERNLRTLVLLEDREFGEVGRYRLYWDQATGLFNEL